MLSDANRQSFVRRLGRWKNAGHFMRNRKRLTDVAVKTARKPGLYADRLNNLYLQVSAFGTKSWIFRFMIDGHAHKMGLGGVDFVSLAEARKRAAAAKLLKHDG